MPDRVLAAVGITNNLFGFTGITAFARYLVAPLMIVWVLYLVIKGLTDIPSHTLTTNPPVAIPLSFLGGIGVAIGAVMWGNEPDTWRYGQPRLSWPLPAYLIALPSATVVMCVDQFLLPRLAGVRRAVERIPTWRSAGLANWPAIVAVLAAVLFGAWGLNLFPWHPSTPNLGLVPVESWLIAGVLYTVLAMGAARSGAMALLGHSDTPLVTPAADVTEVPDDAAEVTDAADSAVEESVHD